MQKCCFKIYASWKLDGIPNYHKSWKPDGRNGSVTLTGAKRLQYEDACMDSWRRKSMSVIYMGLEMQVNVPIAVCFIWWYIKYVESMFNSSLRRVAPLKEMTIPRLELTSARILAQLARTVHGALEHQMKLASTNLWLGSMTALYWIENRKEWKQFVQHKVNEIFTQQAKISGDMSLERKIQLISVQEELTRHSWKTVNSGGLDLHG